MKNINEFTKLFKVNIPVTTHVDYYIETLKKSLEYKDLQSQIELFEDFERFIENSEYTSIKNYKLSYALPLTIKRIEDTLAYKSLMATTPTSGISNLEKNSIFENHENHTLISIDFKNANYSTLKLFDKDNELAQDWKNFISNLGLHPILGESKSFRQFVLGNLNPKRNIKYQSMLMKNNIEYLINMGYEQNIVFVSHDEVVLSFLLWEQLVGIDKIIDKMPTAIPISKKMYRLDKLNIKSGYVQNIKRYGKYDYEFKTLVGIPANKYFRYFKEHILNEPIEEKDLLFINDDELAKWMI